MRGFASARRGPFVSAKGPKTIGARAWPQGVPLPRSRLLGLRNSLRSDSPRLQTSIGTGAQPRSKASGKGAGGVTLPRTFYTRATCRSG